MRGLRRGCRWNAVYWRPSVHYRNSDPEPVGPPARRQQQLLWPRRLELQARWRLISGSGTSSSTSRAAATRGRRGVPKCSLSIRCGRDSCVKGNFLLQQARTPNRSCLPERPCSAPSRCTATAPTVAPREGLLCDVGGVQRWPLLALLVRHAGVGRLLSGSGRVLCRSAARDCVGFRDQCEPSEPAFRPLGEPNSIIGQACEFDYSGHARAPKRFGKEGTRSSSSTRTRRPS